MRLQKLLGFAALLMPGAAHAAVLPFNESIIGNGSAGPYQLTWQHISPQFVVVSQGGQNMVPGLDYTVNGDGGAVQFTRPLPKDSTLFVSYNYDSDHSNRIVRPISMPLSYSLEAARQTNVFVAGSLQNSGRNMSDGLSHLNVGMKSSIQGANGTTVNGRILYSAVPKAGQSSGASDRSGMAIDAQTNAGKNVHMTMNWSRAGEQFDNAGADGLAPGTGHLQVGISGALTKELSASMTQTQDDVRGKTQTTNTLNVAAKPTDKISLSANVNSVGDTNRTSTLSAQAGITKEVSVTASATQTQNGDNHSNQQQVGVDLKPSDKLQVSTAVVTHDENSITTQVAAVNATIKPLDNVRVDAGYIDRSTDADDTNTAHSLDTKRAQLTLTPVRTLSLTGQYVENGADGGGNPQPTLMRGLGLQSSLGSLTLRGGYNWLQATNTSLVTTQMTLGLGLRLSRMTLSADYTGNVASASTPSEQANQNYNLSVSHSVNDRLLISVNGSLQQSAIAGTGQTASNVTTTANLGLKF